MGLAGRADTGGLQEASVSSPSGLDGADHFADSVLSVPYGGDVGPPPWVCRTQEWVTKSALWALAVAVLVIAAACVLPVAAGAALRWRKGA